MISAFLLYPLNVASAPEAPKITVVDHPEPYERPVEVLSRAVLFNCYQYVKTQFPDLPPTKYIWANLSEQPGGVAVFRYPSGLEHYAVVDAVGTSTIQIRETNFNSGTYTERTIPLDDPSLHGFYNPE